MSSFCLVTDIDNTMTGEQASTRELRRAVLRERRALEARGGRLYWVIATGRRLDSAREALAEAEFELGDFDGFVTSVGAELYLPGASAPSPSYATLLGAGGFDRTAVLEALADLEFLAPQPEHEQSAYKVSYFARAEPGVRERIQTALGRLPFATQVIVSHDEYLDVAPRAGGKGGAIAHLLEEWRVPPARTVAAGDSGNDLGMLDREWFGIVVGNASRELAALRARPSVYFAKAKHAAGVLEGLAALGFLAAAK